MGYRGGFRKDLGLYFRSSWEASYARYLNFVIANHGNIVGWEYEAETFTFPVKRGTRFYTPDFRVKLRRSGTEYRTEYHEVKGYLDAKAKTQLKRMKKYYPDVKIVVIDKEFFKGLRSSRYCRLISNWECGNCSKCKEG